MLNAICSYVNKHQYLFHIASKLLNMCKHCILCSSVIKVLFNFHSNAFNDGLLLCKVANYTFQLLCVLCCAFDIEKVPIY